jgi:3-keto-disaccharide hydrolase
MRNFLTIIFLTTCVISALAQEITDPKLTEVWEPEPKVVTPGLNNSAPSDAIILFDGKNLDNWQDKNGNTPKWSVQEGAMTVAKGSGNIKTKQSFGDIQLHIEWRTPSKVDGEGQGRGNSGIFLQERYELQVLDSYKNRTYSNGQAGSIYKQSAPLVNAAKGPGEWQVYDVVYLAPKFNDDGSLKSPGRITVFHNGVLIQHNTEIKGTTEYIGKPKVIAHGKGAIELQDHNNPTSFRNIWVREL